MLVLGVDGCRAGWVGVSLRDGCFDGAALSDSLASLIGSGPWAAVGVDIPLGLRAAGWRAADRAAAALAGPRRSSVFLVPPRPVLAADDYAAAGALCRSLTGGTGLSKQAFNLFGKIREADALWRAGAAMHEVHPELSFAALLGAPLPHPKSTWAGQSLRRRLLGEAGIRVPGDLGEAGRAAPDDVLDAAAVAWTSARIARGLAGCVPETPETCDRGRPITIWY